MTIFQIRYVIMSIEERQEMDWLNRFISYPSSLSHRLRLARRDLLSLRISLFPESRISFNLTNRPTSLGAAHHRGTGLAVSCADQPCLSALKEIVQHYNYVYDYYPTSACHILHLQSKILSS